LKTIVAAKKKKEEFYWRDGFPCRVSANKVKKTFVSIEKRRGHCLPAYIVEEARNPKSVIHEHFFGKTNFQLATQHRIQMARWMLAAIRSDLIVVDESGQMERVPSVCYVHATIPTNGETISTYVSVEVATKDEDLCHQVLEEAKRMISGLRRRLASISKLRGYALQLESIENKMDRELKGGAKKKVKKAKTKKATKKATKKKK